MLDTKLNTKGRPEVVLRIDKTMDLVGKIQENIQIKPEEFLL